MVQAIKGAEIFHHFQRRQPPVKRRGGREKARVLASFFGFPPDIKAGHAGGPRSGREDRGKHAQSGSLARTICAEQAVNLTWGATEAEVLDGANCASLLVAKFFAEAFGYDHSVLRRFCGIIRPES